MLATLEEQLDRAIAHESVMAKAIEESAAWSSADDRAWAQAAHGEAVLLREEALQRVTTARMIVAEHWPLEVAR